MSTKMKKRVFWLAIIFLTIVNLTAFGTFSYRKYCAMHKNCAMRSFYGQRGEAICKKLQLSDLQIKQMHQLSRNFHEKADSLATELQSRRLNLLNLLDRDNVNEKEILAYINSINSLQKKLQIEIVNYLLRQRNVLNEKQQRIFKKMIEQRLKTESADFKESGFVFSQQSCLQKTENIKQCDTLNSKH